MSREPTTTRPKRKTAAALSLSFLLGIAFPGFANADGSQISVSLNEVPTARPELVLQTGHSRGVNCAAFGPDNSWLASGGSDNVIKIWQVATGRELRALVGHTGYIKSLAISPDGKWLASGSSDRTVKVWNVATGRELYSLPGHTSSIEALAFSPENRWLASGSADKTIKIWDLTSGKEIKTLNDHAASVLTLTFSGNGKFLASGSADTTVKVWETVSWRAVRTLRKHTKGITALAFSPDSIWLSSADSDGTVCVWPSESERNRFTVRQNASRVLAVAFESGGLLVSVHSDGGTASWNLATGKEGRAIPPDATHEQLIFASFSSGAEIIAAGNGNRAINLRNLTNSKDGRILESHSTAFNAVDFSLDGHWFASATNDSSIRLWQVATGRELPRLLGHSGYVTTVAFSRDSHFLASGSRSGEIKIWDTANGRLTLSLPSSLNGINVVAFSPDGKFLAAAGMQHAVEVWELDTKRARTLEGHSEEITSVVFSADGQSLVSGGRDKTVRVWDLKTGNVVRTLENDGAEINGLALSSDGKLLAAANADRTVRLWDLATGVPTRTLPGHSDEVLKVAFSPDSQLLASASSDRSVKLWDPKSGAELHALTGASESVNGVAFSSNGRWVLSASDDGSMKVWSSTTGALAATLVSVPNADDWLAATPDGLFDGSPASWNLLLWRFAGDTFGVVPVEAYFNEFYHPGVLAEILAGKNPKAAQDITQKDRRQPGLKLLMPDAQSDTTLTARNVTVKIDVSRALAGAQDLRLFRNGLLVKVWRGDVLMGQSSVTLETTIPIVAGENRLTAYAFNHDNIKSSDATLTVNGADSLKRKGTLHILAVGVSQYANRGYNLNYTTDDATSFVSQLKLHQEKLDRYQFVVIKTLLNENATKDHILAELNKLNASVQPEDAVVVYFSGHGKADADHFYLVPYDLGYSGSRDELSAAGLKQILTRSISDLELEEAFRGIDADQMFMIIDACNSGQALENKDEPRRGPMNTRGLAQLAYEKGMHILTASQNVEDAFVSEKLKHSYLTYALIEDGLKTNAADADHNGEVTLREWFDYAVETVPKLREATLQSKSLDEVDPTVKAARSRKTQTPRVFYRREPDARPLVVANVGTSK